VGSWFVLEFARLIDWDPIDEGLSASCARRIELPHCPLGFAIFENSDLQPAMDDCEPLRPTPGAGQGPEQMDWDAAKKADNVGRQAMCDPPGAAGRGPRSVAVARPAFRWSA
jgi:hypothetical protein